MTLVASVLWKDGGTTEWLACKAWDIPAVGWMRGEIVDDFVQPLVEIVG